MVMPAAASTPFSPSSKSLISSSIFSGAVPVFGSSPIRPARYSVFPVRIASLNGNCASLPGRLIAFLVGCIVTCENAPRTVIIPATAKTTTRKPMRRFMNYLHSDDMRERCKISIDNSSENKERDEPGEGHAEIAGATGGVPGAAALDRCSGDCEGNDPESAGEFHRGADD